MNYKKALFGGKDSIYIFKEEPSEKIQKLAIVRYSGTLGWYSVGEKISEDSIEVKFNDLYIDEYTPKKNLKETLENIVFPPKGNWKYTVGTRIYSTPLKVIALFKKPSPYKGTSNFHILEDEEGNEYIWSTASRELEKDTWYKLSFTIKELKLFRNNKQTIISNPRNIAAMPVPPKVKDQGLI